MWSTQFHVRAPNKQESCIKRLCKSTEDSSFWYVVLFHNSTAFERWVGWVHPDDLVLFWVQCSFKSKVKKACLFPAINGNQRSDDINSPHGWWSVERHLMQKEQSDNFQEEAEGLLPLRQQLYDQTFSWPIQRRLNRQSVEFTLDCFSIASPLAASLRAVLQHW